MTSFPMSAPLVSVVMPVHNGLPYVRQAVRSVLNQTLEDFELVIVNDGSTDGTKEALESFAEKDERIRLFHQENRGVAPSLNRGLEASRGRYIARMDADDITGRTRIQKQVKFLERNPKIGVVGTQVQKIDQNGGKIGTWKLPTDPDAISWEVLFHPPFCHPSIMARRDLLKELGGYAEWALHAEDYELWTRAVQKSRLANLPNTLHKFRKWGGSVTSDKLEKGIRHCCTAARTLHEMLLGREVERRLVELLLWSRFKSFRRAVNESQITDFYSVHRYVRHLYRAHAESRYFKRNTEVRRRAVSYLVRIAGLIGEREGKIEEIIYRLYSHSVPPVKEVPKWVFNSVLRKTFNYESKFYKLIV